MAEKDQLLSALFMNLAMSFRAAAMQQMGKIKNPQTDKLERDMSQARMSIDMLDMLEAKTKNNLTEDEKKFLEHIINELKLNFVEEMKKDPTSSDTTHQ